MTVLFENLKQAITQELARFRNRHFLKATMAASALLATADGEVQIDEHMARDYILEKIEELAVYDVHKAVDMFRSYTEALTEDTEAGQKRAYDAIARFAGDPRHATLLIRAGVLIAKADGNFSQPEKNIINKLCRMLQIDADQTICTDPTL